tara:strand:- start:64 stop:501 length:438 start_codon:yes stop_codon:yes gene_type:complete
MQTIILTIWILQGVLMFCDEFIHHQRGLGLWERVGHPIDSFFFLLPFIYTQLFTNTNIFIILCLFSSLLITKDEFVHSKECEAKEQWLHSVLFVLHPIALYGLWYAWVNNLNQIIQVQSVIIFIFILYQIIYWNFIKGNENEAKS